MIFFTSFSLYLARFFNIQLNIQEKFGYMEFPNSALLAYFVFEMNVLQWHGKSFRLLSTYLELHYESSGVCLHYDDDIQIQILQN